MYEVFGINCAASIFHLSIPLPSLSQPATQRHITVNTLAVDP